MNRTESDHSSIPWIALAGILGFCIGLPLLSAFVTGSIHLPHNDDWASLRVLFHLSDTGRLELVGWNEMMLVGQLAWALPLTKAFGHSIAVLNTANALISGLGLVLTYFLARRFLETAYALLTTFAVGIFPASIASVTTFMTEPSAYAGQMGCLLLGLSSFAAKGKRRVLLLAASMVVGLFAFSVREFSIAAPFGILVGMLITELREEKTPILSIGSFVTLIAAAAALYAWRQSFPGGQPPLFGLKGAELLTVELSQAFFSLSLGLVPGFLFVSRSPGWDIRRFMNIASVGVIALAVFALTHSAGEPTCCLGSSGSIFRGNLLSEHGVLGNQVLTGNRPPSFPMFVWLLISAAAIMSGCLIAGGLGRAFQDRARSVKALQPDLAGLAAFCVVITAGIVVRGMLGGPIVDRYMTILVPIGMIFLLRGRMPPSWAQSRRAFEGTAGLALCSLILVNSGHAFDSARWAAAESAVASGIPPEAVDGGFEWVGFHYSGITGEAVPVRSVFLGPGYLLMFPKTLNCGVVAASPIIDPRLKEIGLVGYPTLLGLREQGVWVYRFDELCQLIGSS